MKIRCLSRAVNVVNPVEMVDKFGIDVYRYFLYVMFLFG